MWWIAALALAVTPSDLRDGDLVFQRSTSTQAAAIAAATGSELTHVGVVFMEDGEPWVFEAVHPVRSVPWRHWVAQGEPGSERVRRVIDPTVLDAETMGRMRSLRDEWTGRPYDAAFAWDDERLYCSELVFKLFARAAGLQVGQRAPIRSFQLDRPEVRAAARARFGERLPLDRRVVSPASQYADPEFADVP